MDECEMSGVNTTKNCASGLGGFTDAIRVVGRLRTSLVDNARRSALVLTVSLMRPERHLVLSRAAPRIAALCDTLGGLRHGERGICIHRADGDGLHFYSLW